MSEDLQSRLEKTVEKLEAITLPMNDVLVTIHNDWAKELRKQEQYIRLLEDQLEARHHEKGALTDMLIERGMTKDEVFSEVVDRLYYDPDIREFMRGLWKDEKQWRNKDD